MSTIFSLNLKMAEISSVDKSNFFMLNIPHKVYKKRRTKCYFNCLKKRQVFQQRNCSHVYLEITLLDVRTPSEYRAGHIPQAINVPLNKIPAYNKSANEVYVICQSGMRSKNAAKILARKNYHVINVRGGMSQWSGQIKGGK